MFGQKKKVPAEGKEFISRAFKFRIWPTEQQADFIFNNIRSARFIYNKTLAEINAFYDSVKDDPDKKEKLKAFKPKTYAYYKRTGEYDFLKNADSGALTAAKLQLDTAFKRFFDKSLAAGYPSFKKFKTYGSYSTCNFGVNKGIPNIRFNEEGKLLLPKIRDGLDIHVFKPIEGTIKSATIEKYPSGKYYVVLLCEIERDIIPKVEIKKERILGISQGINTFCLYDTGEVIESPEFYITGEAKIKLEQKKLNNKCKNSNNYQKQKIKLAKTHEKIANKRKFFAENLSKVIADKYDAVFIEKIVVPPIVTNNKDSEKNKKVYDNGFGLFKVLLKYKMEERGKIYCEIPLDNDDNGGTISRAVFLKQLGTKLLFKEKDD